MYEIAASMTNDEDFELLFVITDENGVEVSIANFNFEFVLSDTDDVHIMSKTSVAGQITKTLPTSTVSIIIDNSEFSGLDPGLYNMACRYTDTGTGRTKQLFTGQLTLEEGGFS